MSAASLETVYEHLAETVDTVEEGKQALFLAKLSLLLANALADPEQVLGMINEAALDLGD